eukprot:386969-Rhodomonas_salina.1
MGHADARCPSRQRALNLELQTHLARLPSHIIAPLQEHSIAPSDASQSNASMRTSQSSAHRAAHHLA